MTSTSLWIDQWNALIHEQKYDEAIELLNLQAGGKRKGLILLNLP